MLPVKPKTDHVPAMLALRCIVHTLIAHLANTGSLAPMVALRFLPLLVLIFVRWRLLAVEARWILSGPGVSCTAACMPTKEPCQQSALWAVGTITDYLAVRDAAGAFDCLFFHSTTDAFSPAVLDNYCYGSRNSQSTCEGFFAGQRLCCCSTTVESCTGVLPTSAPSTQTTTRATLTTKSIPCSGTESSIAWYSGFG